MATNNANNNGLDLESLSKQALDEAVKSSGMDPSLLNGSMSHSERLKSSFKSTDIGNSGKIFGVQLDPATANFVQILIPQALPALMDYSDKHAAQVAERFAKTFVTKDPKAAFNFAKQWGKRIPYGVLFALPTAELAATAYSTSNKLYELRQALSIILKANGQTNLTAGIFSDENNEVIHNARQKILIAAKNGVVDNLARNTITLAPEFLRLRHTQAEKFDKSLNEAELAYIKEHGTQEDMNNYMKERLKGAMETGSDGIDMLQKQKKSMKKDYMEEFETFKSNRSGDASDAMDEAIREGELKGFLEKLGFNKIKQSEGGSITLSSISDGEKDFDFDHEWLEKVEEKWLKQKFGKENGPWDESWMSAADKNKKSKKQPQTREQMLEEIYKDEMKRINGVEPAGKDKSGMTDKGVSATVNNVTQLLATVAGSTISKIVTGDTSKHLSDKLALDMILNMRRSLDENAERDAIPGSTDGNKTEEYSFALYTHKIFQENQRDSGLAEISDRYTSDLKGTNWNDEAIQKMKDSELNPYEVAIKHISQYIRDGRMDALALINLVGERNIVQKSGKSFGLLRGGSEDEIRKALIKEIDKQAALLKPQHKMDEQEISEALGHYAFSKEELQAAFSQSKMDGDAKAFLFTLVDMNTPDEAVVKDITGLSDSQIKDMRGKSQETFTREFDAALREITQDIVQNPHRAPAKYNLSEEQVRHFGDLSRKAQETDATLDGLLTNDNRKQIAATVAGVMIDDSEKHQGHFWRDKIKPNAAQKEQRETAEAEAKDAEKRIASNEEFGTQEERFADNVVSAASASMPDHSNGYMDNMPFVSKDMQQHYADPAMASFADRASQPTSGPQLGGAA